MVHSIDSYTDFEEYRREAKAGLGTYLKVIKYAGEHDVFLLLYLRPRGLFLFNGYWRGYERSLAAGQWVREGAEMRLEGIGRLELDVIPGPEVGRFDRIFEVKDDFHNTPCLIASEEKKGWSLLGWPGTYTYLGLDTIFDPDGRWLPMSLSAVDKRIAEVLA